MDDRCASDMSENSGANFRSRLPRQILERKSGGCFPPNRPDLVRFTEHRPAGVVQRAPEPWGAYAIALLQPFADDGVGRFGMFALVCSNVRKQSAKPVVSPFSRSLNPDCTASGNVNIRVTKQPEHGTVETTPDINFPNYPKENIRSKCNEHKVKGMLVNYESAEKYVCDDTLELLVLFPDGFAWEVHYDISVR
jgi:hypothetical protein